MNIAHTPVTDIIRYRRRPEGPRVLDLGCGDGERAIALAGRRFNRVTGLDSSRSLVELAIQHAARRKVDVSFVCGSPYATSFDNGSFDEIMALGDLFGHSPSARADVDLLREVHRLLTPGGRFHLRFADGDWMRRHYRSEMVEGLPTGFIYRYGTLSSDGHRIRTEVLSSDEGSGIARQESRHEWLYSQREVTELLYRLGFSAITYDEEAEVGRTKNCISSVPSHVAHCRVNIGRTPQRMLP